MEYFYTARFLRSLKKQEENVEDDVIASVKLYESGISADSLKLHKLHGKFAGYHAFSANFTHRVIIKIEKKRIYYLDIGTHDIYK